MPGIYWNCVKKMNQSFKRGDLVVAIRSDSFGKIKMNDLLLVLGEISYSDFTWECEEDSFSSKESYSYYVYNQRTQKKIWLESKNVRHVQER